MRASIVIEIRTDNGDTLFVNPDHIMMIEDHGDWTRVTITGGKTFVVLETFESLVCRIANDNAACDKPKKDKDKDKDD